MRQASFCYALLRVQASEKALFCNRGCIFCSIAYNKSVIAKRKNSNKSVISKHEIINKNVGTRTWSVLL